VERVYGYSAIVGATVRHTSMFPGLHNLPAPILVPGPKLVADRAWSLGDRVV
jgi:hypothetical protein